MIISLSSDFDFDDHLASVSFTLRVLYIGHGRVNRVEDRLISNYGKVTLAQCGKLWIFLLPRFYVEPIVEIAAIEAVKLAKNDFT